MSVVNIYISEIGYSTDTFNYKLSQLYDLQMRSTSLAVLLSVLSSAAAADPLPALVPAFAEAPVPVV